MAALDWKSINLVPRPEVGPDRGKDGWALFGEVLRYHLSVGR